MKKTRVRAFTILEMLINIVIMSIIIGMVYFVYSSFSKQVSFYQHDVEEENALSSFCLRLKADFFMADRIVGATDSFEVLMYDTKSIYYEVENGYLFRIQNENGDSLKIEKIDVSVRPDPVTNENLIQKIEITAVLFEEPIVFTVAKKYPSIIVHKTDYGN